MRDSTPKIGYRGAGLPAAPPLAIEPTVATTTTMTARSIIFCMVHPRGTNARKRRGLSTVIWRIIALGTAVGHFQSRDRCARRSIVRRGGWHEQKRR